MFMVKWLTHLAGSGKKLKQSVLLKDTVHFHYITGGQNSDVYAASEKVWEEQRH